MHPHQHYLDNLRTFTLLSVVFYHVIFMYNNIIKDPVIGPLKQTIIQYQDIFLYFFYPYFMSLLFIISGISTHIYLSGNKSPEKHKEFLIKRTKKLLVPSSLGLFAFHWIGGYINVTISRVGEKTPEFEKMNSFLYYLILCLSGTGPLWFIQLLWVYSLLLILIVKIEKERLYTKCSDFGPFKTIMILPFYYISAHILNAPVIVVYRFGFYFFAFLSGYFIFSQRATAAALTSYLPHSFFISAASFFFYLHRHFGKNYSVPPNCSSFSFVCYSFFMCVFQLGFFKRFLDKKIALFSLLSKKSYGIYIFHYEILCYSAYFLKKFSGGFCPFLHYFLSGTLSFFGSFLVTFIVERIPLVNFLVLGSEKKEKDKGKNE